MTCPPCTYTCNQGDTCPIRVKERERIIAAAQPAQQETVADDFFRMIADRNPNPFHSPQRTWVGLMRGVRVEGNAVVITVKGGNDEARALCGELINEMEKNT